MKNKIQENKLRLLVKSILIKEIKIINENTILMRNSDIAAQVEDIIQTLKNIEVDGETMEYILHQVGMEDQMADQLVNNKISLNEYEGEGEDASIDDANLGYYSEKDKEIDYNMKWDSMDNEDKEDALLSIVEDPDDARMYIDMAWDDLPDYISSNLERGDLIKETKKDKEEEEDVETPEQDEESTEEESTEDISTEDVDPNIKAVQDALTQAAATAAKLNDPKLVDQIGNTVTYFTRTHIVDAPKHQDEMLNENTTFKLWNKIK